MPIPYEPLDSTANEIRWLHLHSGDLTSPVKCTLAQGPLGDYSKPSGGIYDWATGDNWWQDANPENGRLE